MVSSSFTAHFSVQVLAELIFDMEQSTEEETWSPEWVREQIVRVDQKTKGSKWEILCKGILNP